MQAVNAFFTITFHKKDIIGGFFHKKVADNKQYHQRHQHENNQDGIPLITPIVQEVETCQPERQAKIGIDCAFLSQFLLANISQYNIADNNEGIPTKPTHNGGKD